jgi:hypothetical protein
LAKINIFNDALGFKEKKIPWKILPPDLEAPPPVEKVLVTA